MGRRRVAGLGPDAGSAGLIPIPTRRQLHLRRHAVRPEHRALHPRPEGARLQRRLLSVPADDRAGLPWRGRISYFAPRCFQRGDGGGRRLPRLGDDVRVHARRDQPDGRLFRLADRLHLSADDPALRVAVHGRRRRRSVRASARNCAGWRRSAGRPGPRRERPTARAMRSGIIRSSPACRPRRRRAGDLRRPGPDEESLDAEEPDRLFRRLVGLDGLPAPGRERPMAASRSALCVERISISSASTITCRCPTGRPATAASTRQLERAGARSAHFDIGSVSVAASRRRLRPHVTSPRPPRRLRAGRRDVAGRRRRRGERPRPYRRADDLLDPYLKANIEGGEKFDWYYDDGDNGGRGLDPLGSDLIVSLCRRRPARPDAQALLPRTSNCSPTSNSAGGGTIRTRRSMTTATAPAGRRRGRRPSGRRSRSRSASSNMAFPAVDKATNQPNVFFDPTSIESVTPFWSIWRSGPGGGFRAAARRHDRRCSRLQAIYEYWNGDGTTRLGGRRADGRSSRSAASGTGTRGRSRPFRCSRAVWGDAGNWPFGDWLAAAVRRLPPPRPRPRRRRAPTRPSRRSRRWAGRRISRRGSRPTSPSIVSGRATRRSRHAAALYDIELTYELLRADAAYAELQAIAGFFEQMQGRATPFWLAPPGLATSSASRSGSATDATATFALARTIRRLQRAGGGDVGRLGGLSQRRAAADLAAGRVSAGYAAGDRVRDGARRGRAVSADFGALWLCRFADDVADLEEFMTMLWTLETVKLQTVRP